MTSGGEFRLSADALRRAADVIEGLRADRPVLVRRTMRPAVLHTSRGALVALALVTGAAAKFEIGPDLLRTSRHGGSIDRKAGSAGHPAIASRIGALPESQAETQMRNTVRFMAAAATASSATFGASAQQAVQWKVSDGGNGHWYRLVQESLS